VRASNSHRLPGFAALGALAAIAVGVGAAVVAAGEPNPILAGYHLQGSVTPFRDPSIIRVGDTYYVFGTDVGDATFTSLPIRCSKDKFTWIACGYVFKGVPDWVKEKVPGVGNLWAPDISFFNGLYHVYYAASVFGTNRSAIGLATNTTLDRKDPAYKWVDHGEVLSTNGGGFNYNAIDPNILIDGDGSVWMTFGSFWSGIKQRRIDPETGMLSTADTKLYSVAARPDDHVHAIEGSSLVHHDRFYYLFVSFGACCNRDPKLDDYRIVVGRGEGPHGPFLDRHGADMMGGFGEVLLKGDDVTWNGPGGQTVYLDPERGDLITFHALQMPGGQAYLFVNPLKWVDGWPVIEP
jgi:arabinan endo-1,5-alpha-L-arabinosidase